MENLSGKDTSTTSNRNEMYPLNSSQDLDLILERVGDAHAVLLGEASHGTHEFYTWRTAITKRLIEEKGFNFIAVEGDWPDCYKLNRYIKGFENQSKKPEELLHEFRRWPTWMWANWEIAALMNWLKNHNTAIQVDKRVGFYGLDVYSLWESMETIIHYLEKNDPAAASFAHKALKCFEPYGEDEFRYAQSRAQNSISESCRDPLIRLLSEIKKKAMNYDHDPEAALNAEQNAQIALNAEEYYSKMMTFNDSTWNIRDTHMMETLNRLFEFHGKEAKAIVWEHNTHIGDASYTDMKSAGMINIGQLVREQRGDDDVVLIGFGTYSGSVIAGNEWGAPMEAMPVPAAKEGSIEAALHQESPDNKFLIFDRPGNENKFSKIMPHRAIGVVYDPSRERQGNYVPSVLSSRYDAFIFLDKTKALHPLHLKPHGHNIPETYPFNF